jgi:glucose/arabinose dehydrogenase
VVVSRCAAALLLLVLAGCGRDQAAGPENVEVSVGAQQIALRPTQYCLNGNGRRYSTTPPIIEVAPDSPIRLTVPASVAQHGWSVQVFDAKLEQTIGEVSVPKGEDVFAEVNTSDVVPPAFYLVVVENKGGACGEFSGAWPVGFLRAGGDLTGTPSGSAPPAG